MSLYRDYKIEFADNKHILLWWNKKHDDLIRDAVKKYGYHWLDISFNEMLKSIDKDILKKWKKKDPLCKRYAYYNILINFIGARAKKLKLTPRPKTFICKFCKKKQSEAQGENPYHMFDKKDRNYCSPCFWGAICTSKRATKSGTKEYLIKLTKILKIIPRQDFGNDKNDFRYLDKNDVHKVLVLMKKSKPNVEGVKKIFGSHLQALIHAGVLEGGVQKGFFGTRCIALDGHICFSIAEKTIDDFLHRNNIKHTKEPNYPNSKMRADFLINKKVFVEYFGLVGNKEYDKKIREKKKICKKENIELIELYQKDIIAEKLLEKKFKKYGI